MIKSPICMIVVALSLLVGCGRSQNEVIHGPDRDAAKQSSDSRGPATKYRHAVELPDVDQKPGTAVVLLVDTSGSMKVAVADGSGGKRPKSEIATKVMQQVVDTTDAYLQNNPVVHLEFGLISFASSVSECLKIGKFDRQTALAGVEKVPMPNGGTAIGRALIEGFKALHSTGCVRKYLVCVTDGENTSGPDPARIARQLFQQTLGEVEIHFVAFDVSPSKFRFLDDVNGFVVEASDGEQLSQRINEIYEKRILAEAPAESMIDQ